MQETSIRFIGSGRITRIFLEAWKRQGAMPRRIVVSDCNADALAKLKAQFPNLEVASANGEAAGSQEVIFLAVHPPALAQAAAGIKGSLKPEAVVVSLAPKVTIAKLSELLGGFTRIARVIPNAPSIISAGFNPVAFGTALTAEDKAKIIGLLAPLGENPEVEESKLEAYAVLSAMGPTYLWFQLQALREAAAGFGLSKSEVDTAVRRMVCGATRTLLESDLTPEQVVDLVPVKPLAEMEPAVLEMYRTRLPAIFAKIKP